MREVVDDANAARLAPHLHAPAHAAKGAEGFDAGRRLDADVTRGGDGRERV